jgi:hypothetical protein
VGLVAAAGAGHYFRVDEFANPGDAPPGGAVFTLSPNAFDSRTPQPPGKPSSRC